MANYCRAVTKSLRGTVAESGTGLGFGSVIQNNGSGSQRPINYGSLDPYLQHWKKKWNRDKDVSFFLGIFVVLLADFLVRFYLSGAWFNALSLLTLAWLAVFTLPKLYLNNKVRTPPAGSRVVISSGSGSNPDPGFWWPKIEEEEENTAEIFLIFLDQKLKFIYP